MDTIASAVAYAELKSKLDADTEYVPVRLGELNPQTSWVLERAGAEAPVLLPHIDTRACDAMRTEFPCVSGSDPVREAGLAIVQQGYDVVPVVNERGALVGAITARALARRYVCGAQPGPADAAALDTASSELMEEPELVCSPDDLLSDVAPLIKDSSAGAAIVNDDDGHPVGLLGRGELVSPVRRRVILVDHAELAQAVPGIEHAEIVEILDHHHIGSIETRLPVRATFDPIGSTATLVTERFRDHGIEPSRASTMLLLGAVLSDTMILKSPTTTDRDAKVLDYLGGLLGVDARAFGREMFEVSSDVSGVSAAELVKRDAKGYKSGNGTPFIVAQIEVVGDSVLERRQELLDAISHERDAQGVELYALMVTDILEEGTQLLVAGDVNAAARAFGVQSTQASSLSLPGVMSRKKQVAPKLLAAL